MERFTTNQPDSSATPLLASNRESQPETLTIIHPEQYLLPAVTSPITPENLAETVHWLHLAAEDQTINRGRQKYKLERVLYYGPAGNIYLGKTHDNRVVAIKELDLSRSKSMMEALFIQEAVIMRHLKHPNIVPALDFYRTGDSWYYVMPYLQLPTLDDYIAQKNQNNQLVSMQDIKAIMNGIFSATEYGLSYGINQGDMKTNNVFYDEHHKQPLVGDWGSATVTDPNIDLVTATHNYATPGFAGPERWNGHPITENDLVHQTTSVLYKIITGENMLVGATTEDIKKTTEVRSKNVKRILKLQEVLLSRGIPLLPRSEAQIENDYLYKPELPSYYHPLIRTIITGSHKKIDKRFPTIERLHSAFTDAVDLIPQSKIYTFNKYYYFPPNPSPSSTTIRRI